MRRAAVGGARTLAAALLGAVTAWGEAGDASTHVAWSAPPGCPDEAALVAQIAGFLGEGLAANRAQRIAVKGRVAGDPQRGFAADLDFSSARGNQTRTLTHADCKSLTEASALVIALTIDPERVKAEETRKQAARDGAGATTSPPADAAAPSLDPAAAPAPAPVASVPPDLPNTAPATPRADTTSSPGPNPPATPGSTVNLIPSVSLLFGGGMLPSLGTGLGLGFGVGHGRVRFAAVGRYWFPSSEPVTEGAPPAVGVRLLSAGLRVCALPLAGDWALLGCAGPELGDMAGEGQNLSGNRTRHDRWSSLFAGLELSYRGAGRLLPLAGLELGWQLERPRFGFRRDGRDYTVFRPSPFGAQGYLGLGYSL